jgi:hypothetical protein
LILLTQGMQSSATDHILLARAALCSVRGAQADAGARGCTRGEALYTFEYIVDECTGKRKQAPACDSPAALRYHPLPRSGKANAMSSSMKSQLRANAVAIISLTVALTSFSYSTWRNERTEHNRTIRQASFQMLTSLGELQEVVYHAHYDHDANRGNPRTGWVQVQTINDFSAAMPAPMPALAHELLEKWRDHFEALGVHDADAEAISDVIDRCRASVVTALKALN